MQVQNLRLMTCPFEEYLALPGWSYSGIKNEGATIVSTPKMQLGTAVHDYLLLPGQKTPALAVLSAEQAVLVRQLSKVLAAKLGPLLAYLHAELAITAEFLHEGFKMQYKGRIDLCIPKRIVIDVKVSELTDIAAAIKFFGYDKQVNGYGAGIAAPVLLLISINPKNFKTQLVNIPINHYWWEQKVKIYGRAVS